MQSKKNRACSIAVALLLVIPPAPAGGLKSFTKTLQKTAGVVLKAPLVVLDPAAKELNKGVLRPVAKGVFHVTGEAADEIKKASSAAAKYAREHRKEIVLAAVIVGVGYAACVGGGCEVAIGTIGGKYTTIGTIGGGAIFKGVDAAKKEKEEREQRDQANAAARAQGPKKATQQPSPTLPEIQPLKAQRPVADPKTLNWRLHGMLTLGVVEHTSSESEIAENLTESITELIREGMPEGAAAKVGSVTMTVGSLMFDPSTANAPVWNTDMEISARLDKLLRHAMGTKDSLVVKVVPRKIEMPPVGPTVLPAKPPPVVVSTQTITRAEEIRSKAELLATLTGLTPDTVLARVRAGVDADLKERNLVLVDKANNAPTPAPSPQSAASASPGRRP